MSKEHVVIPAAPGCRVLYAEFIPTEDTATIDDIPIEELPIVGWEVTDMKCMPVLPGLRTGLIAADVDYSASAIQ
jgi:hypothetical protein